MKNKIIMFGLLLMLVLVIPFINADLNTTQPLCDADNEVDISDIPCMEITPIILNVTGDCNVTIQNLNHTDIFYIINMSPYDGEGRYNFSLDIYHSNSSREYYTLTLCDNSTSNLIINFAETANELWVVYFIFFIIFFVILMVGEWRNNYIFKYLAGLFLIVIGIYLFINGIPGQELSFLSSGNSSAWVSWASFILIFLGLIYSLRTTYQNVWRVDE